MNTADSNRGPLQRSVSLRPGVHYVVTRDSRNREFQRGDHIHLDDDGSIVCREAMGWMPAEYVPEATEGMEVTVDCAWAEKERRRLERGLAQLQANAKSQATGAALSRKVACTDGLGVTG